MTPSDVSQKMVDAGKHATHVFKRDGQDCDTTWQAMIFAAIRADPETAKAIAEQCHDKMEYRLARAGDHDLLSAYVRSNIAEGFEPIGGVAVSWLGHDVQWAQAMIRRVEK